MPGKVYRTAIYCRLSREDGDKVESNSIASQRAICEDYIARQDDLEIVCEPFVDDGYSGVSFNRPNFKKLEDAIRKGTIDCIVVKDLSRFSRNYIDGGRYLEKIFPQLGIRFIAVNDAYDSLTGDPQSDSFVIPFKNLINDSYCKDISMKIRSSLEVKQKNGEFVGAFAPYGYKKSPDNKNQLIVDEAVSEYVQMIFAMYKDGFSIGRIAARLNQMGVLSPMEYKHSAGVKFDTVFKTGDTAKWTYKAVQRILTNEVYIGVLAQGKKSYDEQYADLSRRLDEAVQRRSKFDEAMSVDNKWITLMKSVSTATQLSQDLVDESVELVKVHEGGAVELVMKYGDIYELTIQSIKEVQEAM